MERRVFGVEPVARATVARAVVRALARLRDGEIEEQREIGLEPARREPDDLRDERRLEAAPRALLGDLRVGVAIREHDLSGGERRADERADVLRAICGVHEQLGERIDLPLGF